MILSADLVYALVAGALVGLGLLMLVVALRPARTGIAAGIARLDADRQPPGSRCQRRRCPRGQSAQLRTCGSAPGLADRVRGRGIRRRRRLRCGPGGARPVAGGLPGAARCCSGRRAAARPRCWPAPRSASPGSSSGSPCRSGAIAVRPARGCCRWRRLRREAAARRQDFRHAVGAFLDLVSMNLAGGRGVPEALTAAASIGDGWAFARIRRHPRSSPGCRASPLGGARPPRRRGRPRRAARPGRGARAGGRRRRQDPRLAGRPGGHAAAAGAGRDGGRAGQRSQSMLVAQMLIVLGYLLFLAYPAVIRIL